MKGAIVNDSSGGELGEGVAEVGLDSGLADVELIGGFGIVGGAADDTEHVERPEDELG
jgi:hypothetical protein